MSDRDVEHREVPGIANAGASGHLVGAELAPNRDAVIGKG
jgi:hypothetical protein